jgi:type IV pilus assembly protein PilM
MDVDSFAFLNCFEANYNPNPTEVIALINIGAEKTNLNVFVGGSSRFCRDITIAGDSITQQIQQRTNCTYSRAEELKIKEGAPMEAGADLDQDLVSGSSLLDTIRGTVEKITGEELIQDSPEFVAGTVIKQTLGQLTSEIRRSIQFYENQGNGRQVQRVVIGGGTSNMKNLDTYLCQELKLPVEVLDPLRNVGFAGNAAERQRLEKTRHLLGVGIGLALRVFD